MLSSNTGATSNTLSGPTFPQSATSRATSSTRSTFQPSHSNLEHHAGVYTLLTFRREREVPQQSVHAERRRNSGRRDQKGLHLYVPGDDWLTVVTWTNQVRTRTNAGGEQRAFWNMDAECERGVGIQRFLFETRRERRRPPLVCRGRGLSVNN